MWRFALGGESILKDGACRNRGRSGAPTVGTAKQNACSAWIAEKAFPEGCLLPRSFITWRLPLVMMWLLLLSTMELVHHKLAP